MDPTKTLRLQPGDVITALPIPREVTAVRGLRAAGDPGKLVWGRSHDGWRARGIGAGRLSAAALLHNYPGGLLVDEVTPEAAPEPTPDVEPEPPIRAKRADRIGSVWTRFPEGWWVMPRAENAPHIALSWEQVQAQGPLREPRPGDRDLNPEPTPEPLPTVTDTYGHVWAEVAPDRWRLVCSGRWRSVCSGRRALDRVRSRRGGTTAPDGRTHTDNDGDVWVLLPDGWAITARGTERPRAGIPGFQPPTPADAEAPELARMTWATMRAVVDDIARVLASVPGRGEIDRATLDVPRNRISVHLTAWNGFARIYDTPPHLTPDRDLVAELAYSRDGQTTTVQFSWTPEHTTGGVL